MKSNKQVMENVPLRRRALGLEYLWFGSQTSLPGIKAKCGETRGEGKQRIIGQSRGIIL